MHIVQQMPLPLTISFSNKSRLVLTFLVLPFWYLLTRVVTDKLQKSSKTVVCVCVCVQMQTCAILVYKPNLATLGFGLNAHAYHAVRCVSGFVRVVDWNM